LIYFKLVLVALFWGGTFIATRIAAQTFEPFQGSLMRYLIACIFFLPLAWKSNRVFLKVDKKQFWLLFSLGLTGIFAYNYFFFRGLKLVPASHGALLVALNPLIVMLFSAIWYKEKITLLKTGGILLSLTGVVIVISRGKVGELFQSFELGDAFMLGCPVTWAIYTLVAKEALKKSTPLVASTWASFTGCIMLALFASAETFPASVPAKVWVALAYLGIIGTVVAFVWYYDGIKKLGATRTAVFNNLVPVFALVLSVLILHETVSWYTYTGALLVIGGVLLINRV
jgi:drug/metabolite transporter (DMT)-like permease